MSEGGMFEAELQGLDIAPAGEDDVAACAALMSANAAGVRVGQEAGDLAPYLAAFYRMVAGGATVLHVARLPGMEAGSIAGMFELTIIDGLSFGGRPRAQVESVHVDPELRGCGIGRAMMRFAEARARESGCVLLQLTSNRERQGAHDFYQALGYQPSHVGYKLML